MLPIVDPLRLVSKECAAQQLQHRTFLLSHVLDGY